MAPAPYKNEAPTTAPSAESIIENNLLEIFGLTGICKDPGSRIESRSLRLNLERFNLNEVISDVVTDYRSEIEKSNSDIELLYNHYGGNKNNPLFIGDRGRITQVISNLVSNAIKFTKKGGSVLITEEERIVVKV